MTGIVNYFFAEQIETVTVWFNWFISLSIGFAILYGVLLICTVFVPSWRGTIATINKTFGIVLVLIFAGCAFGFGLSLGHESEPAPPIPPVVIQVPDFDLPEIELPNMEVPELPEIPVEEMADSAATVVDMLTELLTPPKAEPKPYDAFPEEKAEPKPPADAFPRFCRAAVDGAHQKLQQATQRSYSDLAQLVDQFTLIEDSLFEDIYFEFYGQSPTKANYEKPYRPNRPDHASIRNKLRYCRQEANSYANLKIRRLTYIDRSTVDFQHAQFFDQAFDRELQSQIKKLREAWIKELKDTYPLTPERS